MTLSGRATWWLKRDADRLLRRAAHSSGGPATVPELRYLKAHAELLLDGPLDELSDLDREHVEQLRSDLAAALTDAKAPPA